MIVPRILEPGALITEPGIYSNVPIERYHSSGLFLEPSVSSSGLRTIFNDSPMEYWIQSPLNPLRLPPKQTEAFTLGRATHHLLLGEPDFLKYYAVRPEMYLGSKWNSTRTVCKEWEAEKLLQGIEILKPAMWSAIQGMAGILPWQINLEDSGLKNSPLVQAGVLNGLVEHTVCWRDEETGIWVKIRPDNIPTSDGDGADLKTTIDVGYEELQRTIGKYRYDIQAAMIREGLRRVLGLDASNFIFIFVMNEPPHLVRPVQIKPSEMDEADKDWRVALRTMRKCLDQGRWPGPGGTQTDAVWIERLSWAIKQAEARRKFMETELT